MTTSLSVLRLVQWRMLSLVLLLRWLLWTMLSLVLVLNIIFTKQLFSGIVPILAPGLHYCTLCSTIKPITIRHKRRTQWNFTLYICISYKIRDSCCTSGMPYKIVFSFCLCARPLEYKFNIPCKIRYVYLRTRKGSKLFHVCGRPIAVQI